MTGGSGFIGSNMKQYFKGHGIDVISEKIDIRDYQAVERVLREHQPEIIIHLAAIASVSECKISPIDAVTTNIMGTINVAKLCEKYGTRCIFASSNAVYGDCNGIPYTKSDELHPSSLYGVTKMIAEEIIRHFIPNHVIFRVFNCYGEGCRNSLVVPDTIRKLLNQYTPKIPMHGTGTEVRDFIYIGDVCSAFYEAVIGNAQNVVGTFNLATGIPTTINELVRIIAGELLIDADFEFDGKARPGDIEKTVADIRGDNSIPGWKACTTLEQGIKNTVAYFKGAI